MKLGDTLKYTRRQAKIVKNKFRYATWLLSLIWKVRRLDAKLSRSKAAEKTLKDDVDRLAQDLKIKEAELAVIRIEVTGQSAVIARDRQRVLAETAIAAATQVKMGVR